MRTGMQAYALLSLAATLAGCVVGAGGGPEGGGERIGAGVRWSVSYHTWPGQADEAARDLALIAELGAEVVRTDIWWYAVEPERGALDQGALDYYRWYVEEAGRHGLEVLVVLSNAPDWAKDLYYGAGRSALCAEFGEYAAAVGETVGDLVTDYQLWNEPNHLIDFADGETDLCLFAEGRRGLERTGAGDPGLRTFVNVLVDGHDAPIGPSWQGDLDFYMSRGAGAAIDVIAIDHYPGTWSIGDWGGNILDRLFAIGEAYGKEVAVLEIGFSTPSCLLWLNTEERQASWIRDQLRAMREKLRDPAVHRGVPFALANWFKLDDRPATSCWDIEDKFGVVRADRSRKPAYDELRRAIAAF